MLLCNLLTLSRAGNSLAVAGLFVLWLAFLRLSDPGKSKREILESTRSRSKFAPLKLLWLRSRKFLALIAAASVVLFFLGETGRHRLSNRVDYGLTVKYDELRAELAKTSLRSFSEFPLTGVGLGNWHLPAARYGSEQFAGFRLDFAHNEYLQLAVELGITGVLLALFGVALFFFYTLKALSLSINNGARLDLLGSAIAVSLPLLHSLFDFPLHIPGLALLMAVAFAIHVRLIEQAFNADARIKQ
jgi:O-antigen ligase